MKGSGMNEVDSGVNAGGEHRNQALQVQNYRAELSSKMMRYKKGTSLNEGRCPSVETVLYDGYIRCRRTLRSLFDIKGNAVTVIQ